MSLEVDGADSGERTYEEREAVAVFRDEAALHAAVDELMQAGLRQEDMSLLAHGERLAKTGFMSVEALADAADTQRAPYVGSESRTEALSALVGGPALVAGLGVAAVVGTGGAALIPVIAATAGGTAVGGALGMVLARVFGRKHADQIAKQVMSGGLLLWVHAPDPANDAKIVGILKKNGASDVHLHVITRSWGIADVPLHDANPDPLLR
ncbi:hypothetical protein [Xanthobacter pseudotagetidis]|uniref:hypothetical protein n=1 Tax=Xanthobacter pseudotagetidis TaxID=3119911 RepID=UPI0037288151